MEPISATIAIISATRQAIGVAKNIKEIGANLAQLFNSHEGAEKKKKKQVAKTRRQQILRMRSGDEGYEDETSISSVADQVIEEKNTALELKALANEIDKRWGHGTWNQILEQRQRLLKEKADAAKRAKQKQIDDKAFWHKCLVEGGKVILLLVIIGCIGWWLHYASTVPKGR